MSWKAYPEYKSSGVEWLGEVPEHWHIRRLKYNSSINDEALPETTDPEYEFNYVDIGNVDSTRGIVAKELYRFENAPSRARRIVRKGDIIVSTVRTYLRAIAPIRDAADDLVVSTGFAVIRPRKTYPNYLFYALRSPYFVEEIVSRSTGVSYPAINATEVGTIAIIIPELNEQRAIASFLDRETARIDSLIEKKQRQIELLQEKRSALISHAVTKGLDPNVKMKESGMKWLGEVPEHWEVYRLKFVARTIMGQSPSSDSYTFDDSCKPFLQGNAEFGPIHPSPKYFCDVAAKQVPKGSLLVSVRAPVGALNIADQPYGIGRGLCAVVTKGKALLSEFAWYALTVTRNELWSIATGSTYEAVSADEVASMKLVVPPLAEQYTIRAFLDHETARHDVLIEKVQKSIDLLREYRTALISAAVTGKIDVRNN